MLAKTFISLALVAATITTNVGMTAIGTENTPQDQWGDVIVWCQECVEQVSQIVLDIM